MKNLEKWKQFVIDLRKFKKKVIIAPKRKIMMTKLLVEKDKFLRFIEIPLETILILEVHKTFFVLLQDNQESPNTDTFKL